jgi:dihydrofolate synthase/folylpolyglutamate synthase
LPAREQKWTSLLPTSYVRQAGSLPPLEEATAVGMTINTYDAALAFLLDRINYERTGRIPTTALRLDRMRELVRRLGDPHLRVPVVHVAGTKGKGSTATMIAAILQAAGYRTGLYTSPHLERIEERFVIDGAACSPQEFVDLTRSVEPVLRELDAEATTADVRMPTFFEITTAMAFVYFAQRPVDIAVLEVGLGGRLDSTNVCQPLLSIITSISLDHTRQLGNTLAAIAREKAGIIKPGVPVISGVVDEEPRQVIEGIAAERGSLLLQYRRDFEAVARMEPSSALLDGSDIVYCEGGGDLAATYLELKVRLPGEHQVSNAATAIAAAELLSRSGWKIPEPIIGLALANVRCPARIEVVRREPTVVVDTAHNVASIDALCRTLHGSPAARRILIFASSKDKDVRGMLRLLLPEFDEVVLTRYVNNPRARTPEKLQTLAAEELPGLALATPPKIHLAEDPLAAWRLAQQLAGADGLVCITGSFFLAAELRGVVARRD